MATRTDAKGRRKVGVRLGRKRKRVLILNERDFYAFKEFLEIPLWRTKTLWRALPPEIRGGFFNFRDRMGQVLFEPGGYIAYPAGQRQPHGGHLNKPAIWRLETRGKQALKNAGEYDDDVARFYTKDNPATNRAIPHAMLTWDPLAELKIGVNEDPLARWRSWTAIISNAPDATKKKEIPYQFRVTIKATFKSGKVSEPLTFNITPDGQPFGLSISPGLRVS